MSSVRYSVILTCILTIVFEVTDGHNDNRENGTYLLSRQKRSTCAQKFSVISGHTACLPASASVQESGVSAAEQTLILNTHNNFRANVTPTATDMTMMTWDDEVASIAQKWAENCVISHDQNYKRFIPGRLQLGQNLAYGSAKMTWDQPITLWHNEVVDFTLGGSNSLHQVGHYTQVVWAKSSKIGCGYAKCGSTYYYVCNYSPPGNLDINNPYTSGTSCSQCPSNCNNNLCDCGGLVCLNGGTLNLNTCTCSCLNYPHYVGNDCSLNCSLLQQNPLCGNGAVYIASNCPVYSNVPFDCPQTCNVCPYGGIDFIEQSSTSPTEPTDPSSSISSTPSTTSTSTMPTTSTTMISTSLTSSILTSSISTSTTASSSTTTREEAENGGSLLVPISILTFVISIMNTLNVLNHT